ncbi:MAG: DUF3303 domain-containing protein [Anaerolineales bacterium]|jgi:hypothetical protein
MSLFFVQHQHSPETCPAMDPQEGSMLLDHIDSANARKYGLQIFSDAVLDNQHTFVLIVEADNPGQIENFMQPFNQIGRVDIWPASTCETVVEREGC